jgi:hypothetical protein
MLKAIIDKAAVKIIEREEQGARNTTKSRRPAKTTRARKSKAANT